MAVERCLHNKNFYNAEWKNEIYQDFLVFVDRLFNNEVTIKDEKVDLSTIRYGNLEDLYVMWLKSNGCFDWEDDDEDLEDDEYCEGTYEDEIYSCLENFVSDINMKVNCVEDIKLEQYIEDTNCFHNVDEAFMDYIGDMTVEEIVDLFGKDIKESIVLSSPSYIKKNNRIYFNGEFINLKENEINNVIDNFERRREEN